eukprot:GHVT01078782.1.p1 GENE.GHVT01078782.1~~GHVT01078782.1.p1  ORF type:complete len:196 (-),score=18.34 GHVT01078782.1:437-1024(-)
MSRVAAFGRLRVALRAISFVKRHRVFPRLHSLLSLGISAFRTSESDYKPLQRLLLKGSLFMFPNTPLYSSHRIANMDPHVVAPHQPSDALAQCVAVFVTVPSEDVANNLAHVLVEDKVAACVNILPKLTSVYEWEGKIEKDEELLLMIKSRQALVPALTAMVKKFHPYDCPEVIAIPIVGGNQAYIEWIGKVTSS